MKIAVTADLHLTSPETHAARFKTLEILMDTLISEQISTLIVAGDLFDAQIRNAAEVDRILSRENYRNIRVLILPGNHDSGISRRQISAPNADIIEAPRVHRFGDSGFPLCFLPYQKDRTMGDCLGGLAPDLPPHGWILIGHGDRVEGMRDGNPLEPGIYMPLTRSDLEQFRPANVLLGHIHRPSDREGFHYAGSPYPLDPSETGPRRFLILDTDTGQCRSRFLDSGLIYMREEVVVLPMAGEPERITEELEKRIASWPVPPEIRSRLSVMLKIRGYSDDKSRLREILEEWLSTKPWGADAVSDLDEVFVNIDPEKAEIARHTAAEIDNLEWPCQPDEPTKDAILLEALHVIYGD